MDVIGHDYKGVELEAALISIAEEGFYEEICVGGFLEVAMAFVGGDRYGVCV